MKEIQTEVLIIGAGLAGVSASLSAQAEGREVLILAKDSGASAMSSGALDFAGDPLAIPSKPEKWSLDQRKNLSEIIERLSHHPYGLLFSDAEQAFECLNQARRMVFGDGFLEGEEGKNIFAFNQLGTFKATAWVQKGILKAKDLEGKKQAVLFYFKGLKNFDPEFFERNFLYWSQKLGADLKLKKKEIVLEIKQEFSSLEFSRWAERNSESLLEELVGLAKGKEADLILFPSLFSQALKEQIFRALEKESSAQVRELLALPPSVPGKRLQEFLTSRLEEGGIKRLKGKALGFRADGRKVKAILARVGRDEIEISAQAIVLATGSFLSGGIFKQGEFKEEIFGLKIFSSSQALGRIFTEKLTSKTITSPQAVFSVGIKVNENLQPVDEQGRVVFENLFACGSILNGCNYIFDGTGAGTSLLTGLRAGKNASNF